MSRDVQRRDQRGSYNPAQDRVRREKERAEYPTPSTEMGIATRAGGFSCLVPALRNVRLPKDFKGPRKVPNYTADLQPEAWIESYEMAMELLEVGDAAMAKYFTMMLDGTARSWFKGLPPDSIGS